MNTKRKARKSSSDSNTSGNSPAGKRAREILLSSNSSPERSADMEAVKVIEMPENLESISEFEVPAVNLKIACDWERVRIKFTLT